jgi:hypothetical protein
LAPRSAPEIVPAKTLDPGRREKIEEETSDKGSSAGSSLEADDDEQRIKDPAGSHSIAGSAVRPPTETKPAGSRIPVKRSPQKKRAPQPPKLSESCCKSFDADQPTPTKSFSGSKLPLKLSESGGKAARDKNSVKKALFSSDPQLNLSGKEAASKKGPRFVATSKPASKRPPLVIESIPITVNSHIPSSGPQLPAALKRAETSEAGTQMEACEAADHIAEAVQRAEEAVAAGRKTPDSSKKLSSADGKETSQLFFFFSNGLLPAS